jgi:transposase-like protein
LIWRLDEVYLKINGGMALARHQRRRGGARCRGADRADQRVALKLMRELLKKRIVVLDRSVTDDLKSYGAALRAWDRKPP